MTHNDFTHLLSSVKALSPEQMRQLRQQLDSELASAEIRKHAAATPTQAEARKPIWEEILELAAEVPDEEWDKLPADGAEQHDHYVYGTPKRPPAR